jgi:TetR/AcrR family transcriptional regulator, tetracycline repressor protein
MGRPKTPLISRRGALDAALDIADNQGLSALSIRRLGEALNVNGASLYHHFKNKEEILIGITQLALEEVTAPRDGSNESWRTWVSSNASLTREALVAHPELIPLMLERDRLDIGARELGASVERMEADGVSIHAIAPILHTLELLAVLSAMQETSANIRAERRATKQDNPQVNAWHRAEAASALDHQELFEALVNATLTAIETAVQFRTLDKPQATQ